MKAIEHKLFLQNICLKTSMGRTMSKLPKAVRAASSMSMMRGQGRKERQTTLLELTMKFPPCFIRLVVLINCSLPPTLHRSNGGGYLCSLLTHVLGSLIPPDESNVQVKDWLVREASNPKEHQPDDVADLQYPLQTLHVQ